VEVEDAGGDGTSTATRDGSGGGRVAGGGAIGGGGAGGGGGGGADGEGRGVSGEEASKGVATDNISGQQLRRRRVSYRSQARVLLLGQGADEQCAGYGRHRTVFRKAEEESTGSGWAALDAEMRMDVRRLWAGAYTRPFLSST